MYVKPTLLSIELVALRRFQAYDSHNFNTDMR